MSLIAWIILALILLAVIIVLLAWFYRRSSNEEALVRTGIGGRRVVLNGGTITLPYFHEINRVNMQTLRLDVERNGEQALITKDRLRVDVSAEFYTSVAPDVESVARAAQTLGKRTFNKDELRALIDGLMVDALRAVAARMTMDELHENRSKFATEVRESLTDPLSRYGLELDAVSLTALDQTPFDSLDENNAFNAVGMRKLAEVIATNRKERAHIDADADVSVRRASMEAARLKLDIDLEERRAQISQQQEIEKLSAAQIAEIATTKAQSELQSTQARIDMERDIEAAEISRDQALRIAERNSQIALYEKSIEERRAEIEADRARAEATIASEAVETSRAIAEAERQRSISVLAAETEATANAKRTQIEAASKLENARSIAEAHRENAAAEKDAKIAEAEALRAHHEANNARSEALIAMELEKAKLDALPKIVSEMVKPAEKIKSININQLSGLSGSRSDAGGGDKPVVNQALDSIMDMAVQMPALKKIGEQVGLSLEDGMGVGKSDRDED